MSNITLYKHIRNRNVSKIGCIIVRWIIALFSDCFLPIFPVLWIFSASFNPSDTLATSEFDSAQCWFG